MKLSRRLKSPCASADGALPDCRARSLARRDGFAQLRVHVLDTLCEHPHHLDADRRKSVTMRKNNSLVILSVVMGSVAPASI